MINHERHIPHDVETGDPTEQQLSVIQSFVTNRHVHDLGAGDLTLAGMLLGLGARRITAVDKDAFRSLQTPDVDVVRSWFHDYKPTAPLEVAFVSWPIYLILSPPAPHILQGLPKLCAAAPVVIYLGSNFGSLCGNLEFWQHVGTREVLAHVPDPRNTLIVYGRQNGRVPGQKLLPEEKAALYRGSCLYPEYGVTYG